jgi:hypothetical protein
MPDSNKDKRLLWTIRPWAEAIAADDVLKATYPKDNKNARRCTALVKAVFGDGAAEQARERNMRELGNTKDEEDDR